MESDSSSAASDVNSTQNLSASILLMLSLLFANEYGVYFLQRLKQRYAFLQHIQTPTITTLIGVVAGFILKSLPHTQTVVGDIQKGFSQLFLVVMLPPILYEGAINMEKIPFFKNFGSILVLAVVGTVVSFLITALFIYSYIGIARREDLDLSDAIAFGALIQATNPVSMLGILKLNNAPRQLIALIFGESILNNAVSMIFFETSVTLRQTGEGSYIKLAWRATLEFLLEFSASIAIGCVIGMISAYILKSKRNSAQGDDKSHANKEMSVLICIPWVSYLIASMLRLSGIVSIVFCGITMARYALPNVTETGLLLNEKLYSTLAYNFDNLAFLFIGIGISSFQLAWAKMGIFLFFVAFIAIIVARFASVNLCVWMLNRYRTRNKISSYQKFLIWVAGFRGSMAFALATQASNYFPVAGNVILTVTLLLCVINIVFNSSALPLIVNCYNDDGSAVSPTNENAIDLGESRGGFWNEVKGMIAMFDANVLSKCLLSESGLENRQHELEMHEQLEKQEGERARSGGGTGDGSGSAIGGGGGGFSGDDNMRVKVCDESPLPQQSDDTRLKGPTSAQEKGVQPLIQQREDTGNESRGESAEGAYAGSQQEALYSHGESGAKTDGDDNY